MEVLTNKEAIGANYTKPVFDKLRFVCEFVSELNIESPTYGKIVALGGMTERLKVTVLKTVVVQATVGSNPTPSAARLF
jgi:hypothetical protein